MIEQGGIYHHITHAQYRADPCPQPSFTQSLAKILLARSPLHAWYQHPRLNPHFQADDDSKFDLGNTAHLLLLGKGKDVVPVDFPDWRTKAAREHRQACAAAGKLAVLQNQYERALEMCNAAVEQCGFGLFRGGQSEICLAWQEAWQEGGIWLRQLVDWSSSNYALVADYKTTTASAAPHEMPGKMASDGWHIQAAMAERGLDILHPQSQGHRKYYFVCQETEPPYLLTITQLRESALVMGRKQLDYAIEVWRRCMNEGKWPGYPRTPIMPEFPQWAENQWLLMETEREIENAERKSRESDARIQAWDAT